MIYNFAPQTTYFMEVLGIDIGGSGIKGTLVNTKTGEFTEERYRIPTPQPATPEAIANTIKDIADHFNYSGVIGCGFPSLIKKGVIMTASNIDKSCIGVDANKLFTKITGRKTLVWNDADVAGYAEMKLGTKSKHQFGIFITIGTGIGTAFIMNGKLLPNTELGHVYMENGLKAEKFTSDAVRKNEDLDWETWGKRFNSYLQYMELLFSPDVFILGGGASKKYNKFADYISVNADIEPSTLLNKAGIVGAALLAHKESK
jgi:polyphosphate glucokinase